MSRITIGVSAVALGLATMPVLSQGHVGYGHDHMWGGSGWVLGPIFMILILAAVAAVVIVVIKVMADKSHNQKAVDNADDPVDILRIRYAKGEIDQEEFERRMKTLGN